MATVGRLPWEKKHIYYIVACPTHIATLEKETKTKLVVEPTHLKNISQNGNLPQIGVKIKHIWNHHLETHFRNIP